MTNKMGHSYSIQILTEIIKLKTQKKQAIKDADGVERGGIHKV